MLKEKVKLLEVGKEYTYKGLIEILGEKNTNNREKQYEKWRRFFEFERRGRKYIITTIRENPIPDGRSRGNNSKYIQYFEDAIMYSLEGSSEMIYRTKKVWLITLGLLSLNVFESPKTLAKSDVKNYITYNAQHYISDCLTYLIDFIGKKFGSTVERLEKRGYLVSEKTYRIKTETGKEGIATLGESIEISDVHTEAMNTLGVKSYLHAKWTKQSAKLDNIIAKELHDRYGYLRAYAVLGLKRIPDKDYVYNSSCKTETRDILLHLLNNGIKTSLINKKENNEQLVSQQKEALLEAWYEGEDISNMPLAYKLDEYYAENMIACIDLFLSL